MAQIQEVIARLNQLVSEGISPETEVMMLTSDDEAVYIIPEDIDVVEWEDPKTGTVGSFVAVNCEVFDEPEITFEADELPAEE